MVSEAWSAHMQLLLRFSSETLHYAWLCFFLSSSTRLPQPPISQALPIIHGLLELSKSSAPNQFPLPSLCCTHLRLQTLPLEKKRATKMPATNQDKYWARVDNGLGRITMYLSGIRMLTCFLRKRRPLVAQRCVIVPSLAHTWPSQLLSGIPVGNEDSRLTCI